RRTSRGPEAAPGRSAPAAGAASGSGRRRRAFRIAGRGRTPPSPAPPQAARRTRRGQRQRVDRAADHGRDPGRDRSAEVLRAPEAEAETDRAAPADAGPAPLIAHDARRSKLAVANTWLRSIHHLTAASTQAATIG